MCESDTCRNLAGAIKFGFVIGLVIFAGAMDAFASGIQIHVVPDKSTIVQVVNFILLIVILNAILYKPIRKIIADRKEKISDLEKGIEGSNQSVLEKDDAYKEGIKEARTKGLAEKDARVEEATIEEKKIIEEINKKAQSNLSEMREKIVKDVAGVKDTLQKEIDTFAENIGQKILGRAI